MKKVVINTNSDAAFSLSREAFLKLRELGQKEALAESDIGESDWGGYIRPRIENNFGAFIPRDDTLLVKIVEEMGSKAFGPGWKYGASPELKIVAIPENVDWRIVYTNGQKEIVVSRIWE